MRQITPLRLRQKYWRAVDEEIKRLLRELIYRPLLAILKTPDIELLNADESALQQAIRDGRIWYEDGHFAGDFNAELTKELRALGAMYNQKSRTWSLTRENVPTELRIAQALADDRYNALRRSMVTTLGDMNVKSIDEHSDTSAKYGQAIEWMNDDFQKAVRAIAIPPQLTGAQQQIIADQWGQNLDLYIKDWAQENILELREKVQANAFEGRRASDLVDMLQQNYGVARRKAEFLARQETSLLMSKFQETRYRDIGVRRYRWSGANDARERPDHRALNGKVFSFDQPPITNRETGARNNPGEDYNCRCVAIALIE